MSAKGSVWVTNFVSMQTGSNRVRSTDAGRFSPGREMGYGMPIESDAARLWKLRGGKGSAGELISRELQPVQVPQRRNSDCFGLEELLGQAGEILGGHGFDSFNQFIEIVIAVKVHFLTRQVRHARGARLQRQHEAAFQLCLGAAQFFFGNGFGLQLAKLTQHRLDNFGSRGQRGARINGETSGIAVGIQVAVNRVRQTLSLANVLKQTRTHTATE